MNHINSDKKKKILIIEDEMQMRFFLSTLLETNGFTPVMARNGNEGIRKAKEIKPDMILLDVMMPESGGAHTYRQLKMDASLQRIPIIILSAVGKNTFYHYLKMLKASGDPEIPLPDNYIEKPPDARHLLNAIQNLM